MLSDDENMLKVTKCGYTIDAKMGDIHKSNRERGMKMKKLIALILVVSMGLMLCACGKSEEVKATEEAIKQIGEVNFRSGDLINNAEELFEALTPEEQATVKNADTLMDAVEAYDIMVLQPVDSYVQKVLALRAATNEFDLTSCFDLIENLRKEYDAMHPELREIMIASSEDDGGLVGMDTLADLENALLSCRVVL